MSDEYNKLKKITNEDIEPKRAEGDYLQSAGETRYKSAFIDTRDGTIIDTGAIHDVSQLTPEQQELITRDEENNVDNYHRVVADGFIDTDTGDFLYREELQKQFDDEAGVPTKMTERVERMEYITRDIVQENPDKIFLFGDNLEHTGFGGQAKEMRGEPNAIGIPTKKSPSMDPDAFFTDAELDVNKLLLDDAFDAIPKDKIIVIPTAGLGTGLAELEKRAPQTFEYLQTKIAALDMDEMTTSGGIGFARGGMMTPSPEDRAMLKDTSQKKNKAREKKLKEAFDSKLPWLKKQILGELQNYTNEVVFKGAAEFQHAFPKNVNVTSEQSMIRNGKTWEDLERVEDSLPDDVGELELMLTALKEKAPLTDREPFSNYKYLCGVQLAAKDQGIKMLYEGYVSMAFTMRESLYISDLWVTEDIAKREPQVRVIKKMVYPVSGRFEKGFWSRLRETIEGTFQKPPQGDKQI